MKVGLFENNKDISPSLGLSGDNFLEVPYHIEWVHDEVLETTFFTDHCLDDVKKASDRVIKVAWLVEPPDVTDTFFYKAFKMQDQFDYILTFCTPWIAKAKSPKWLYYPLGGSSIKKEDWGIGEKTKNISMYYPPRQPGDGQLVMAEVARKADTLGIDLYMNKFQDAKEYLQDYRYSVIVEKVRMNGYFSHRLVDCLSQGTIPLYWGDRGIGSEFDPDGITPFENVDELVSKMINEISDERYMQSIPAIMRNLDACETFYCAEDWIFTHLEKLFEDKNA